MSASETRPWNGDSAALVDYAKSLDCIRCGLCLQGCPTFRISGVEASSPRGRIHIMRAAGEGRIEADPAFVEEIDYCLLCLRCESMCPAGVRLGEMVEHTRAALVEKAPPGWLVRLVRWLAYRIVLPHRLATRFLASVLRLVQLTRTERLLARLLGRLGRGLRRLPRIPFTRSERFAGLLLERLGDGLRDLPRIPSLPERRLLPELTPARGEERARVAVLEGCVMPELFSDVNHATVDSLAALGIASQVPRGATCCGSLHAHNGDLDGARLLARRTIEAFETCGDPPVVVNSAGCGAHMRTYPRLFEEDDPWRERAVRFSKRVVDYSEYVAPLLVGHAPRLAPGSLPLPATWDDPCHLCHGQGIRAQPRRILASIEGLEHVELPDSEACCGSAGIYSLLRPDDGQAVFEEKLEAFRRCGARSLITANPGCQLQWSAGLRRNGLDVPVVHIASLVARSLVP